MENRQCHGGLHAGCEPPVDSNGGNLLKKHPKTAFLTDRFPISECRCGSVGLCRRLGLQQGAVRQVGWRGSSGRAAMASRRRSCLLGHLVDRHASGLSDSLGICLQGKAARLGLSLLTACQLPGRQAAWSQALCHDPPTDLSQLGGSKHADRNRHTGLGSSLSDSAGDPGGAGLGSGSGCRKGLQNVRRGEGEEFGAERGGAVQSVQPCSWSTAPHQPVPLCRSTVRRR